MKALLTRYIMPWLITMAIAFIVLNFVIFFMDGFVVYFALFAFAVVVFGTVPFLIWQDYRLVRNYVASCKSAYLNPKERNDLYFDTAVNLASHFGMPEFVCERAVKMAKRKLGIA